MAGPANIWIYKFRYAIIACVLAIIFYAVMNPTRINGYLTPWGEWEECDKLCGGGIQARRRTYIPAENGGIDLSLDERNNIIESKQCNDQACPVDGSWGDWSQWGECSKPCGSGVKERSRIYNPAQYGGVELEDRDKVLEIITCNEQACPMVGYLTEWGEWSECDKECGGGMKERRRTYMPAENGGIDLSLDERNKIKETTECNTQLCPIDGYFTSWTEWSKCDKECGGGFTQRSRTYVPAQNGGVELIDRDNILEVKPCNEQPCPINGSFSQWSEWGKCDKDCGGGLKERSRTYYPAQYGGIELDDRDKVLEQIACNEQACPINGYFTEWSEWSGCDKECGGGTQIRTRTYVQAKYGGTDLSLDERNKIKEARECNTQVCPTNGTFTEWSAWGICSKPCEGGIQSRTRKYIPATNGGADLSLDERNKITEEQVCNTGLCPLEPHTTIIKDSGVIYGNSNEFFSPNKKNKFIWLGDTAFRLSKLNDNQTWGHVYSYFSNNLTGSPSFGMSGNGRLYLRYAGGDHNLDDRILGFNSPYLAITDSGKVIKVNGDKMVVWLS